MTRLIKTNGERHTNTTFFRKDNKIILSVHLVRNYIDGKFDIGSLTIRYNDNNIYCGECMWHNENDLLKAHDDMMDMFKKEFDFDELSHETTIHTRIIKKDVE